MARIVNPAAYDAKRGEIIDAAQRLIYSKGYERMSIQDILEDLQISKGAFYHYFDSKPAVLEAFIDRMQREVEAYLLPILDDPHLSAIEKLQGFFTGIDHLRVAHQADVITLGRVWYNDDNAIVRQKVDAAIVEQRAPLLNAIVRQGIAEGVFTTPYPEQAGDVLLSLLQGMSNAHARLMLSLDRGSDDEQASVELIVAIHGAYMEAIERVLGAPSHSLTRADAAGVQVWVAILRGNPPG